MYLFLSFAVISFCLFASWFSSDANAVELTARASNIVGTVEVIRAGEVEAIPIIEVTPIFTCLFG